MRLNMCFITLTVPVFLGACAASRPEPGTLLKTWQEGVATLGIRPVYPLQENLYPGNLLLMPTYPGKSRSDFKTSDFYNYYPIPIGSLDLCRLYLSIQNTPEMPLVESYVAPGASQDKILTPWPPTAINYSNLNCRTSASADFKLNRTVAFPAFQFGSFVEGAAGANLIAGTVGAKGSVAGRDDYRMTVSIPSVTIIKVDIAHLLDARFSDLFYPSGGTKKIHDDIAAVMSAAVFIDQDGNPSMPELLVVSEVYYANAIDISITASAAQAEQLAVSTRALVERFDKLDALQKKMDGLLAVQRGSSVTNPPQATLQQNTTQTIVVTDTQQNLKNDLARQIDQTQSEINALSNTILPNAPGLTGAVKSATSYGVTLTQVFPRPLAVGYRALAYNPVFFMKKLENQSSKKSP